MKQATVRAHLGHGHPGTILKLIGALLAGALVLMLAAGGAAATEPDGTATVEAGPPVEVEGDAVECVTMAIDLEEGGVIDFDVPGRGLRVDTWKGEEILLIVEKKEASLLSGRRAPVNIEVIRSGRNVRIAAPRSSANRMQDLGISFRLLVPEAERRAIRHLGVRDSYNMSKLTHVLFRVLSKEALSWIAH